MIGVVGDDTTGSLDIGVMFHRAGCSVQMFTTPPQFPWPAADVTIIDTNSRLDSVSTAYAKVFAATRLLQRAGCSHFYKKTCSVFRGNIGAELDAMLDATGETNLIVASAYPLLGRTTRDGLQFVHGLPLEQSSFAHDPVHPRTTSDLSTILNEQTDRAVGVIPLSVVRSDQDTFRARLEMARDHPYLVIDSESQEDLARLGEASDGFRVFGGSAGFASEWPRHLHSLRKRTVVAPTWARGSEGVLFIAGSLTPQTKVQTQRLIATGIATIELDPLALGLDPIAGQRWVATQGPRAAALIAQGESVLIFTTQDTIRVETGQQVAQKAGLEITAYSRLVSSLLAALSESILAHISPAALIVAGGDTSGAISRRLGISGCQLVCELEPGIPLCVGLGPAERLLVVFKSGSFGRDDFLVHTGEYLRELNRTQHPSPC